VPPYNIPLSAPNLKGNEWLYVKECLDSEWISSAGKFVELFERKVADFTGAKFAIACVNGTSALHVSLRLANVQPDDEVILSTLTFIAPVNAISYNRATPIFMDADEYYNLDIEKTIDFIKNETIFKKGFTYNKKTNNRISAIIPIHIWGNAVNLDLLISLCEKRNIAVIEDASESLGSIYKEGKYKGKHTGTVGKMGCLSFNGNKIITSGGGGMILTDNKKLADSARYLTTQAKDDPVHFVHNEIGYNFRLTNIQAALGLAQLEQLPGFLSRKLDIHNYYKASFKKLSNQTIAGVPSYAQNNHWVNVLQLHYENNEKERNRVKQQLEYYGIESRVVWTLNHKQKIYENCQAYQIENANKLVEKSLCLPSSSNLSYEDINKVINVTSRLEFPKKE